jgi:hypothetical protein
MDLSSLYSKILHSVLRVEEDTKFASILANNNRQGQFPELRGRFSILESLWRYEMQKPRSLPPTSDIASSSLPEPRVGLRSFRLPQFEKSPEKIILLTQPEFHG